MNKLNENYYLRKCYLERNQVPTQSVILKKMTAPLANVYFKTMTHNLKILAGLEPPMKGGGSDWYMPPEELLAGRAVLKPTKKKLLSQLGFNGIDAFGDLIVKAHHTQMDEEKRQKLQENDKKWKSVLESNCKQQWEISSLEAAEHNTKVIKEAYHEFETLYATSINKIETILFDASVREIKRTQDTAYHEMKDLYHKLLKQQATMLSDRYENRLMNDRARLKAEFVQDVENSRTDMARKVHDIHIDKHVAVEKLRKLLECQNLACQIYVALKEREQCKIEIEKNKHIHEKKIKKLDEEIWMKNFEITLAKEKETKCKEFNKIWKTKVCHIVKKFQMFVGYCLKLLPEYAEFFINIEKLLLIQMSEAIENPSVESIIEQEEEKIISTPIPKPHPFYVFFDNNYKTKFEQHLVPKHCTSSASQLPVIVVNKRCIYAACDNLTIFKDKINNFILGKRCEDFSDDQDYGYAFPARYTSREQLLELKFKSSLMQILQSELPNINKVPVECCVCKIPYCFCSPLHASSFHISAPSIQKTLSARSIRSGKKIDTREIELKHEREPKWDSYIEYIRPKKCKCAKTNKKHLLENMPPYMRLMSKYTAPDLPNYEMCSMTALKKLVKRAQGKVTPPSKPAEQVSNVRVVGIQFSDQEFEYLCDCFSDVELEKLCESTFHHINAEPADRQFIVGGSVSSTYLDKGTISFASERVKSLRRLLGDSQELEELFKKSNCRFEYQ